MGRNIIALDVSNARTIINEREHILQGNLDQDRATVCDQDRRVEDHTRQEIEAAVEAALVRQKYDPTGMEDLIHRHILGVNGN